MTDNVNSYAELLTRDGIGSVGSLSGIECVDELKGFVELPKEMTGPATNDCTDLLNRLLDYDPQNRIRSMFKLQRIAFYMGYNFDDVRKKKVNAPFNLEGTNLYLGILFGMF